MDHASLLQRLHYIPQVSISSLALQLGNMRVVTLSDDAADKADGADHAEDGKILVLTGG